MSVCMEIEGRHVDLTIQRWQIIQRLELLSTI